MGVIEKRQPTPFSQLARQSESKQQHPSPNARRRNQKPLQVGLKQTRREFNLRASLRFTLIGPVRLSLRRLDAKQGAFDLYFFARDSKVRKLHLEMNQPRRIAISDRSGSMELVVARVSADQVQGYISVPNRVNSALKSEFARPSPNGM
jgi:hypothetical protein